MKYVVTYTDKGGERKEVVFTTYNEARKELNKLKEFSPKIEIRKD